MKQVNAPENEEAKSAQKAQSPQDLQSEETPSVASEVSDEVIDEEEPIMEIGSLTEEPIEISLERVAELKRKGNYEVLEYHIRRGEIELLPTQVAKQIVTNHGEHQYLMHAVKCLLLGLRPMLERKDEIAAYIDPTSSLKLNMGKFMEEMMNFFNPMGKNESPLWNLMKGCFDKQAFAGFPTEPVKNIINNQGFDLQPYLDMIKQLGLFEKGQNSEPAATTQPSGMKPEDRVALTSISDEERERYLILADVIAHPNED